MKIVLIHGQSHKGTSYHIGRSLADKLETEANISEFFLPKDMPHFCLGCYSCLKGEENCPHRASIEPIKRSIDEADLMIFTTPVYCLRASGSMKALFDHLFIWWMSHRPKENMLSKRAVVIAVGAGTGMNKAIADIKINLSYWGISEIMTYGQRSLAMSWEEVNDKIKTEIEKNTRKLAGKIKKKNGPARVSLGTKIKFIAMRVVQLKGWGACTEDREYWQNNGWLAKSRPWKI